MKILLLNGSPRPKGNTAAALDEMEAVFAAEGLETERVQVETGLSGVYRLRQVRRAGPVRVRRSGERAGPKLEACDGLVVGSPVYYASANATLVALLTRLFYSTPFDKTMKVGAAVAAARRGGLSSTFDELNKFFTISGMPVASSQYWNSIHGRLPGEAAQDAEGLQTMRTPGPEYGLPGQEHRPGPGEIRPAGRGGASAHPLHPLSPTQGGTHGTSYCNRRRPGGLGGRVAASPSGGVPVTLREMKPAKMTPAHHTEWFGSWCAPTPLRSDQLENAVGLLKEELRRMDSPDPVLRRRPPGGGGGALAVDRHGFARAVTEKIRAHPLITVEEGGEVTQIPESGERDRGLRPLTSDPLAGGHPGLLPESRTLNFYDAAAPWSPSRAWIWTAPSSPPATTGGPRTTSTAP